MTTNILTRILQKKREEVEAARRRIPVERLQEQAALRTDHRPFLERLRIPCPFGANIIAEIKRGSPSKGTIRDDLGAADQARCYERGGAAAMSVLTDQTFFLGRPEDLQEARSAVNLPVLRKDFLVTPYQIYESAAMGADAVLLIVGALSPELLAACLELCEGLRLDALVEVHTAEELEAATRAGARLIGINNRDLKTFRTDIQTSATLAGLLSPGQIAVAESGLHGRDQIETLLAAGVHNFLIGESLVRAEDPVRLLGELLGITEEPAVEPLEGAAKREAGEDIVHGAA